MWETPPSLDNSKAVPCPAPWFVHFSSLKTAAEVLGCSMPEVDALPVHWKLRALSYARVMEQAKPGLEVLAEQRATSQQEAREQRLAARRRGRI